jgi:hypothetical protein
MTDFGAPLPKSTSLDVEQRFEFSGWHQLIASEVEQLLGGRSASWLTSVAKQIGQVLDRQWTTLKPEEIESAPSIARSHGVSSLHPDDAQSQIHDFAVLEPHFNWPDPKRKGGSLRWERYAVFALWKIHDATRHLPRTSEPGDHPQTLLTTLYEVDVSASLTIEAMRALQIAQGLKFEADEASRTAKDMAEKRHAASEPIRDLAMAYAKGGKDPKTQKPFGSRAFAARAIAEALPPKPGSQPGFEKFYTPRCVEDWLVEKKWKPSEEMKAASKAFDAAQKEAARASRRRR